MEAEDVLKLYDSCWFEVEILKETPNSSAKPTSSEANPEDRIEEEEEQQQIPGSPKASLPKLSRIETIHTRSMSDSITSFKFDSFSPDTVLLVHSKLQTILSGKEVTDKDPEMEPPEQKMTLHLEDFQNKKKRDVRRRRNKKERKSMSDLEFEELKGFMDLGFVFSEEDKDSDLASIIPGLQRLGKKDVGEDEEEEEEEKVGEREGEFDESKIPRPYLSEAWEFQERRREKENIRIRNPLLMNWRVPSSNNEIDVKDSLKLWAHTVASTVT